MTKTQISVRVTPDTLAAIDAAAEYLGISRGAVIDRWLAAQASQCAAPVETQAWYRAGELASKARDDANRASKQVASMIDNDLEDAFSAIRLLAFSHIALANAIDVLAGTAPE